MSTLRTFKPQTRDTASHSNRDLVFICLCNCEHCLCDRHGAVGPGHDGLHQGEEERDGAAVHCPHPH